MDPPRVPVLDLNRQPAPLRVPVVSVRTYAFDISIPREVKGELTIVGPLDKDDLDRVRQALNGQLSMIEAALED